MLRVLHVLKFEIFKHLIYVTTFTGFELKNSFKVENENSKLNEFFSSNPEKLVQF